MEKLKEVRVDIDELERLEREATQGVKDGTFARLVVNYSNGNVQKTEFNCSELTFICALLKSFPSIIKELSVLREAVKRFEGMEITDFEETMEDYKGLNAVNNLWKHKRNAISAWVKEQLGE